MGIHTNIFTYFAAVGCCCSFFFARRTQLLLVSLGFLLVFLFSSLARRGIQFSIHAQDIAGCWHGELPHQLPCKAAPPASCSAACAVRCGLGSRLWNRGIPSISA